MLTKIDHLVIGAANLAQGVNYVKEYLGVDMPYGGEHPKMGTHNHLMRLGSDMFLEVIAINPAGESPENPRWYGLDDPFVGCRLAARPALLTWVVNTNNIGELLKQAKIDFGEATALSRGALNWSFGLPDDGRLLAGGMLPYAIEWPIGTHPSKNMADAGCRFKGLEIYHPYPVWLQSVLDSIGAGDLAKIYPLQKGRFACLVTHIDTPTGEKELRSDAIIPPSS
ncbi:MAG: VOC family protein [Desulfobacterales bacterium]